MVKSINELKEEKRRLLLRQKAEQVIIGVSNRKALERKRLQAEVNALKNPGSLQAKRVLKNITRRTGLILFKNAVALGRHLSKVSAEQNRPTRKKKMSRKKR